MSDLVKASETVGRLCDRIEQLERELAKWRPLHPNPADARYWEGRFRDVETELEAEKEAHKACEFMMQTNASMASDLAVKLAAEKALADALWDDVGQYARINQLPSSTAYRKARGL